MSSHYRHLKKEPCFWPNDSVYFLTDSTFTHFPYFNSCAKKQIVLNQIEKINSQLEIPVSAYSIAINHYHIKFFLKNGLDLKKVKQLLRGGISYEYRSRYNVPYDDMWQTRDIKIITSEKMNWLVTGYIAGNLLKHKEVSTFDKLLEDKFSSYWFLVDQHGKEEANNMIRRVIDVNEDSFSTVDLSSLEEITYVQAKA